LMALAASGEGVAIVPSNVSIPRKGVKTMSVTHRGTPIGALGFGRLGSRTVLSALRPALRERASRSGTLRTASRCVHLKSSHDPAAKRRATCLLRDCAPLALQVASVWSFSLGAPSRWTTAPGFRRHRRCS
jgi:hypothetical protein